MQGHVDGVGDGRGVRDDGFARVVTIAADAELLRYVVEKGSIAVDGVSLTVARGRRRRASTVSLIPETLERTNLGEAAARHAASTSRSTCSPSTSRSWCRAMSAPTQAEVAFATIEEALEDIAAGQDGRRLSTTRTARTRATS